MEDIATLKCGVRDEVIDAKLDALWASTRADREGDDLRLPWTVTDFGEHRGGKLGIRGKDGFAVVSYASDRAAKLMSAAPELLDACKLIPALVHAARTENVATRLEALCVELERIAYRALRKVESGVPE